MKKQDQHKYAFTTLPEGGVERFPFVSLSEGILLRAKLKEIIRYHEKYSGGSYTLRESDNAFEIVVVKPGTPRRKQRVVRAPVKSRVSMTERRARSVYRDTLVFAMAMNGPDTAQTIALRAYTQYKQQLEAWAAEDAACASTN